MTLWQYFALAGFGAVHGLNPGMVWLIALAAGVRERSRTALVKTLLPIAAGHALSILVAAYPVSVLRSVVTTRLVAIVGGVIATVTAAKGLLVRTTVYAPGPPPGAMAIPPPSFTTTEAACCRDSRTTRTGSITPDSINACITA